MLADVAQHVEERERRGPVGVINEQRRVGLAVKIQKTGQLFLDPLNVGLELLVGEQLALGALAAGVTDRAGRAAGDDDRLVAELLEAA